MSEPWAYVAHKDGMFAGACAVSVGKRDLKKFIGDFVIDGFTVQPVSNRDEYLSLIKDMPMWKPPDNPSLSLPADEES